MAELKVEQPHKGAGTRYSRADIVLAVCLLVASLAIYIGEVYTCFNDDTPMCFGDTKYPPDFAYLWTISYLQVSGDLSQLFDPAYVLQHQIELTGRTEEYLWSYSPQALFLLRPLAMAPLVPAYLLWVGTGLALLAWACLCFTRFRWFFLAALILSPAVFVNGFTGNNGFITAALLIGGILLSPRRPIVAGILFGLLTFKPHLGLLVPVALVAARLWRPFVSATVTSICLVIASMAIHGIDVWATFVTDAAGSGMSVLRAATGPFTNLMPTIFMAGRILEMPELLIAAVQGGIAIAATVATYVVVRRNSDPIVWAAVISLGTFLVSPYGFSYDMVVVAAAMLLLILNSSPNDLLPFERVVLILLWMLPVVTVHLNTAGIPLAPLILSTSFIFVVVKGLRGQRTTIE